MRRAETCDRGNKRKPSTAGFENQAREGRGGFGGKANRAGRERVPPRMARAGEVTKVTPKERIGQ